MKFSNRKILESLILGENPNAPDEFLNDDEFEELQQLNRSVNRPNARATDKGKVYILPGIMGSTLWRDPRIGSNYPVWINPFFLAAGAVRRLKINPNRNDIYPNDAVDILYLKMKLRLKRAGYDAEYLPFDWRFSPNDEGARFIEAIKARNEKSITLVCHSMGGLVARQMAALDPNGTYIKRVVTIGTPNYGSYSAVQAFALTHSTLKLLATIDTIHSEEDIMNKYVKHFRGLLEMLPDKRRRPNEDYFKPSTWSTTPTKPARTALSKAKAAKAALPLVDDRFTQIVGMNEDTLQSAYEKNGKLHFDFSNEGDGTVPRDLAEMGEITRYFTNGKHRRLPGKTKVIKSVMDIIETGKTSRLRKSPFKRGEALSATRTLTADELRRENDVFPSGMINDLLRGMRDDQLIS